MKKTVLHIVTTLMIIGISVWLFAYDKAAEPGVLSWAHESIRDCETCHLPWRGVTDQMCLQCHSFRGNGTLKPQLQFHQAHAHCLDCHSEHKGYAGTISKVDHTLFNGELACTQCHFDAHNGKFGRDCRACHEITTWEIDGFRHPSSDNRDCHRCHAVPTSHEKEAFLKELKKRDMEDSPEETIKECWGCHTIYRFYGIAQND